MSVDAQTLAAINAGIQQTTNTVAQGKTNKKTREWNEKMYDLQRKHALEDWQRTADYNSPAAQMQRFKDAGLNPHLIYKQTNEAPAVSSADVKSWNPDAPQFSADLVQGHQNVLVQQQQIDNMQAQKLLLEKEANLKDVQALASMLDIDVKGFDLEQRNRLKDVSYHVAVESLNKLRADIQSTEMNTFSTAEMVRRMNELQPFTIQKVKAEISAIGQNNQLTQQQVKESKQRINNMIKDGTLKDWEIKLNEKGLKPSDPLYQRVIWDKIQGASGTIEELLKKAAKELNLTTEERPRPKSFTDWLQRLSPY